MNLDLNELKTTSTFLNGVISRVLFLWKVMLTIEVKLNHKDLEKLEYILKEDELPITENEIKLLIKRLINRRFLKC